MQEYALSRWLLRTPNVISNRTCYRLDADWQSGKSRNLLSQGPVEIR